MNVLIVGAGGIAGRHVDRLNRIEDVQVVGVCDLDIDRARRLAERCGGSPATYTDFAQAIGAGGADYLLLTTPRCVRLPVIEACVEAGLPVLMEKPPCHDLETGERIADLLDRSGLLHSVGFMHRWHDGLNHG